MQKKFCGKCGAPIVDDSKFCGSCGAAIEAEAAPAPEVAPAPEAAPVAVAAPVSAPAKQSAPKKEKKSKKKLLGILIPVAVVVVAIAVVVGILVYRDNQYKTALELLDDGDIAEAVEIHKQLGDYEDLVEEICEAADEEFADQLDKLAYKKMIKVYTAVTGYPEAVENLNKQLKKYVSQQVEYGNYYEMFTMAEEFQDKDLDIVYATIYDKACGLMEEKQYYNATTLFTELEEYKDSADKIKEIEFAIAVDDVKNYAEYGSYYSAESIIEQYEGEQKEKLLAVYLPYCADSTFLEDLESALQARDALVDAAGDDVDYEAAIDAEWDLLDKYWYAHFYDRRLQELANQYLNALDDQDDALWYDDDEYDFQYYWNMASASRYEALELLQTEYSYTPGVAEIADALGTSSEMKKYWEAWWNVHNDLSYQLWGAYIQTDENGQRYLAYTNNTSYTFDVDITVEFTDYNDEVLGTSAGSYAAVAPGQTIRVVLEEPEDWSSGYVDWVIGDISEGATAAG